MEVAVLLDAIVLLRVVLLESVARTIAILLDALVLMLPVEMAVRNVVKDVALVNALVLLLLVLPLPLVRRTVALSRAPALLPQERLRHVALATDVLLDSMMWLGVVLSERVERQIAVMPGASELLLAVLRCPGVLGAVALLDVHLLTAGELPVVVVLVCKVPVSKYPLRRR